MARLPFKFGVFGPMLVSGLLAISCGGPESDGNAAESQQLSEKKAWQDITSFLGRWNGNRKCGGNKDESECMTGEESGGLRFQGNRSGCEWRGDKCQVSCGRIAGESLCGRSDACKWNENGQKCYLDQAIDSSEEQIKYTDVQLENDFIGDDSFLLSVTTYCYMNSTVREKGCLAKACVMRKGKCRAACARIVTKTLCGTTGATGCIWKGEKCVVANSRASSPGLLTYNHENPRLDSDLWGSWDCRTAKATEAGSNALSKPFIQQSHEPLSFVVLVSFRRGGMVGGRCRIARLR